MSAMAADGSNSGRLGAVHVPQAPAGAHGDTVLSIVVSPDGKRAVTGACGLLRWLCFVHSKGILVALASHDLDMHAVTRH